mmetsp:Transcript_21125/g.50980  ORF Transcript_21125/g.50980 Transcript_21125/m.50980 type:complete len:234 (+) Transcript_21125:277-978(+)
MPERGIDRGGALLRDTEHPQHHGSEPVRAQPVPAGRIPARGNHHCDSSSGTGSGPCSGSGTSAGSAAAATAGTSAGSGPGRPGQRGHSRHPAGCRNPLPRRAPATPATPAADAAPNVPAAATAAAAAAAERGVAGRWDARRGAGFDGGAESHAVAGACHGVRNGVGVPRGNAPPARRAPRRNPLHGVNDSVAPDLLAPSQSRRVSQPRRVSQSRRVSCQAGAPGRARLRATES